MFGDATEDMAQVSLGVDAVEFGCLCRPPNYAERFWNDAVYPANLRALSRHRPQFHSA
jgi:hypothetical protein